MNNKNEFSFDLSGKVAVVMGGAGVLCSDMCRALADAGAQVAILDLDKKAAESLASQIKSEARSPRDFHVTC